MNSPCSEWEFSGVLKLWVSEQRRGIFDPHQEVWTLFAQP
jgi:hypothetical protein